MLVGVEFIRRDDRAHSFAFRIGRLTRSWNSIPTRCPLRTANVSRR
jgi:hypothetical protein